jgi:hypothetical protein
MKTRKETNRETQERRIYRDQLITVGDLEDFRIKLLDDIKVFLKQLRGEPGKKWLKSYEVKKLLSISPGTLQNLRVNGTLPFIKIGSIILYDNDDVQRMIKDHKQDNSMGRI